MIRFETLYSLPQNLYVEGSPIIIEVGKLLKDTVTGSIVAQIKYKSLSNKNIKALKVKIAIFDVTKQQLGDVIEYQYLDLTIRQGQEFGSDKAIIIPNVVARSFLISEITVIFGNNEQWVWNGEFDRLVNSQMLQTTLNDDVLVKQYRLETNESANYMPKEMLGLWQCSCGDWNAFNDCNRCKLNKTKVFSTYNIEQLTKNKDIRIKKEAEECAIRKAERERQEQQRKKRVKIGITVSVLLCLLIGTIVLLVATKPDRTMKKAVEYIDKGNYAEALSIITELNDKELTNTIKEKIDLSIENSIDNALECANYKVAMDIVKKNEKYIDKNSYVKEIQQSCPHKKTYEDNKEPTCEDNGYNRNVCEICGYYEQKI